MTQLVVRNLENDVKAELQKRARRHRRSTEEEVREILRNAVRREEPCSIPGGKRLRALFRKIGIAQDIPEWRGSDRPGRRRSRNSKSASVASRSRCLDGLFLSHE